MICIVLLGRCLLYQIGMCKVESANPPTPAYRIGALQDGVARCEERVADTSLMKARISIDLIVGLQLHLRLRVRLSSGLFRWVLHRQSLRRSRRRLAWSDLKLELADLGFELSDLGNCLQILDRLLLLTLPTVFTPNSEMILVDVIHVDAIERKISLLRRIAIPQRLVVGAVIVVAVNVESGSGSHPRR